MKFSIILLLAITLLLVAFTQAEKAVEKKNTCFSKCAAKLGDKKFFRQLCKANCNLKRKERVQQKLAAEEKKDVPAVVDKAIILEKKAEEEVVAMPEKVSKPANSGWSIGGFIHNIAQKFKPLSDACPPIDCFSACGGGEFVIVIVDGCRQCKCLNQPVESSPAPVTPTVVPSAEPSVAPPAVSSQFPAESSQPAPVESSPSGPVEPTPAPVESSKPEHCVRPRGGCWWKNNEWHQWKQYLCCIVKKLKHRFCRRGHTNMIGYKLALAPYYRMFGNKINEVASEVESDEEFVREILSEVAGIKIQSDFAHQVAVQFADRFAERDADSLSDDEEESDVVFITDILNKIKDKYFKKKPKKEDKKGEKKEEKATETEADLKYKPDLKTTYSLFSDSESMSSGLTLAQLKKVMPTLPSAKASQYISHLNEAMNWAAVNTCKRRSAFLSQVAHESADLRYMEEIASGKQYEGRKDLGNTHKGDGVRYKGRGPIQVTGRANYRAAGKALGVDLEGHPTLAATPKYAFKIAAWYWKSRSLNGLADQGTQASFDQITRRINGGLNGKADRDARWRRAKSALGC